jgi:hypothetical protein
MATKEKDSKDLNGLTQGEIDAPIQEAYQRQLEEDAIADRKAPEDYPESERRGTEYETKEETVEDEKETLKADARVSRANVDQPAGKPDRM